MGISIKNKVRKDAEKYWQKKKPFNGTKKEVISMYEHIYSVVANKTYASHAGDDVMICKNCGELPIVLS